MKRNDADRSTSRRARLGAMNATAHPDHNPECERYSTANIHIHRAERFELAGSANFRKTTAESTFCRLVWQGNEMNIKLVLAAGACLLSLGACGHKTAAADNVAAATDNAADKMDANASAIRDTADAMGGNAENAMDSRAQALNNKADAVRSAGENQADAMDAATKKK